MKLPLALACLLLTCCVAEQPQAADPQQTAQIAALKKQIAEKEQMLELQSRYAEDATRTIVALQEHMAQTEAIEDAMGLPDPSGEGQRQSISVARRDQLLAGVARLQMALQEQAKLISDFRQREGQYTLKIGDLEKAIANYETQIAESQRELVELRSTIQEMRVEVQELQRENQKQQEELVQQMRVIAQKDAHVGELQRASRVGYYTARPLQELLKAKIVVQRRVMLRRIRTISPDVKRSDFDDVNIDEQREFIVPAPMQKIEIVTTHPRTSYQLSPHEGGRSKLTVLDPDEFWKLRYFIVALK
jgi:septal ring factor EnvC (AmiA/AmiB activator)